MQLQLPVPSHYTDRHPSDMITHYVDHALTVPGRHPPLAAFQRGRDSWELLLAFIHGNQRPVVTLPFRPNQLPAQAPAFIRAEQGGATALIPSPTQIFGLLQLDDAGQVWRLIPDFRVQHLIHAFVTVVNVPGRWKSLFQRPFQAKF